MSEKVGMIQTCECNNTTESKHKDLRLEYKINNILGVHYLQTTSGIELIVQLP